VETQRPGKVMGTCGAHFLNFKTNIYLITTESVKRKDLLRRDVVAIGEGVVGPGEEVVGRQLVDGV